MLDLHYIRAIAYIFFALCASTASGRSKYTFCTPVINSKNLPEAWDYVGSYGLVWQDHARTVQPTPATIAGNFKLAVNVTRCTTILVAPQTFQWSKTQGQTSTFGFGTTKAELNHVLLYKEVPLPINPLGRALALDYTITLPTNGTKPIIENYAHQFLASFNWDQTLWANYEVDAGDLLGARPALPGYTQTGLLTLIATFNGKKNGKSSWSFPIEVDAGTASDAGPSSVVSSEGASYTFANNWVIEASVITGLTANDPKIGFAFTIKRKGNLTGKSNNRIAPATLALLNRTFTRRR